MIKEVIKVFCDLCGREYEPSILDEFGNSVILQNPPNRELLFTVKIQITPPDDMHEICGACRWMVITALDPRPKRSSVDVKV